VKPEKFQLTFLFDQKQISKETLLDFITKTLDNDVTCQIGFSETNDLLFTLEGSLGAIDNSHVEITKYLFERKQITFFRLKDTAGDEIRERAYPIMSAIEQELRSFINKCLIDVFGLDWWTSFGDVDIPGSKQAYYNNETHPLERMTFDELINFITYEKAAWEEESPISVKDFAILVNNSDSFNKFQSNFEQKTRKISLWHNVFSKYLNINQEDWFQLKKRDLRFVIDVRNKVMHHRPLHLSELNTLEEKRKNINKIITSAKSYLTDKEKEEITKLSKEIRDVYSEIVFEYSEKNAYHTIINGLQKVNNFNLLQNINKELDSYHTNENISEKEFLELKAIVFERTRELLGNDIDQTRSIIINDLLPFCLQDKTDFGIQYREFRKILIDWIEGHSSKDMGILRDQVISIILPLIGSEMHNQVCWTISTIGYKQKEIIDTLWKFASASDNEKGDLALTSLISLGLSKIENKNVLDEIHNRIKNRYNYFLLSAIAKIGDPTSIDLILEYWLTQNNRKIYKVDASLAFTAIREILAENDNDISLQERIWKQITALVESDPKALYWDFDVGHIAKECNCKLVIPNLLKWFSRPSEWFENPDWALYLVEERIALCVKPKQLEGWVNTCKTLVKEPFINKVLLNTENDLFAPSQKSLEKENAWKTILRAGCDGVLNYFNQAVVGEKGRFVKQNIMNLLSCLRFNPLPKEIIQWITEPYDDPGSGDSRELAYRMAAVQLAQSTATEEAFDALLNFGFVYKGHVITKSTEALAEVSLDLLKNKNDSVIEKLSQIIVNSEIEHHRFAAICSLEIIASIHEYQNLILPCTKDFSSLLYDKRRSNIERGYILITLAQLINWQVPGDLLSNLIEWAHQPDEWIGNGSLQLLASHGIIDKDETLMRELLGIEKEGNQWKLINTKRRFEWFPYIIGILYNRNPNAFSKLIAEILLDPELRSINQIVEWLIKTHDNYLNIQIDNAIIEALLDRSFRFSSSYTETSVIDAIRTLSPSTLLKYSNIDLIKQWIPNGRIELANSLGKIKFNSDQRKQCLSILEELIEDNYFQVRRAAYRAIAKQDPAYLYSLCKSWGESPIIDLNLRAAEAFGWIEYNKLTEEINEYNELPPLFKYHQERQVREIAKQSLDDHKKRIWSKNYLDKVLGVQGKDNYEILQNWYFGDALSLIGDDECRNHLISHLSTRSLPPNVKYWINSILKGLDDNWKKVIQKMPDPWYEMEGVIRRGQGKFNNKKDPLVSIDFIIWFKSAFSPTEKHSWGGTMIIPSITEFIDVQSAEIITEDNSVGNIIITRLQGNVVTFQGSGEYPFYKE